MPQTASSVRAPHDDLFHALDRQRINVDGRTWRLRVHSIRLLHDTLWVHVDAVGSPIFVLTLRQVSSIDATAIVRIVRGYLEESVDVTDAVVFDLIAGDPLDARTTAAACAARR